MPVLNTGYPASTEYDIGENAEYYRYCMHGEQFDQNLRSVGFVPELRDIYNNQNLVLFY